MMSQPLTDSNWLQRQTRNISQSYSRWPDWKKKAAAIDNHRRLEMEKARHIQREYAREAECQ